VNATKVVTFNAAAELNLGPATLLVASSSFELAPVETKFDAGTQRATLIFTEDLPAGSKATLRVGFESALIDSMSGYYKSTWDKGTYALTQFEVRVWPYAGCWIRPLLPIRTSKWWRQRHEVT
jgi:aminopeptidase 2